MYVEGCVSTPGPCCQAVFDYAVELLDDQDVCKAIGEAGVNIRTIAQGADELAIVIGVEEEDYSFVEEFDYYE